MKTEINSIEIIIGDETVYTFPMSIAEDDISIERRFIDNVNFASTNGKWIKSLGRAHNVIFIGENSMPFERAEFRQLKTIKHKLKELFLRKRTLEVYIYPTQKYFDYFMDTKK